MTSPWLLAVAGLVSWLVAGLPVLGQLARTPERLSEPRYLLWTVAFTVFGAAFWTVSRGSGDVTKRQLTVLVAVQVLATLVAMAAVPSDVGSVLLVITASQFAWLALLRLAVALVAAQTAAATLIGWAGGWGALELLFNAGVFSGFQLFALFTSYTALKEAEGRAQLTRLNAELHLAQALLSESSRLSERLRIARDLHDLIGHHLTALSLNLEVAGHLADGKAKAHIETSQGLAKGLLSDVREAVGSLRGGGLELSGALRVLVRDIPTPRVHVELAQNLQVDDPGRAQVLLRVVQEIITNTVRHAHAENLWLTLEPTPQGVRLSARDDGQGTGTLVLGNGLTGMRERLETLGGRLELHPNPGRGFALTATFPT